MMHVHEYQAKALLKNYGIAVPPYAVVGHIDEVQAALERLGVDTSAVLKIQVHAGGRGQGGGVKLARSREEIMSAAQELLGMRLVNRQTGPEGIVADLLLISPLVSFTRESYLAVTLDRTKRCIVLLASAAGGMDIEEVAPSMLLKLPIPPNGKLRSYQKLRLIKQMGWSGVTAVEGVNIAENLIRAFIESDSLLLEINPLIEDTEGHLIALDAKWTIDDDALFRHPDYKGLFDPRQLPAAEIEAHSHGLSYVALTGNIGCMVNGAGLAMATMDIIHYYGGSPANFLDVGGGASEQKIAEGFALLLSDMRVEAILVNIFGGIMNCGTLARGLVAAASQHSVNRPLVVRMEGTNVEEGRALLRDAALNIILAEDLADAARKVVAATKETK